MLTMNQVLIPSWNRAPSIATRPRRTTRPTLAPCPRLRREQASAAASDDLTGLLAEQLLRLTRRLHRIQRRQLEPLGITPAQSRLLRTLAHCEEPPRMADLAQRLDVVPRAVTTLVDGLEAAATGAPGRRTRTTAG